MKDATPSLTHYDDGSLRAFLDDEAGADTSAIDSHLAVCQHCRTRLEELRQSSVWLGQLLSVPADPPDQAAALQRFQSALQSESDHVYYPSADVQSPAAPVSHKGNSMKNYSARKTPRWLAPVAALVVAVALLALPPVRAAADQLLQIFRVQTVMFVPVSQERIDQLGQLNLDEKSLFVAEPTERVKSETRSVADAAEASAAVGFDIAEPDGQSATSYSVASKSEVAFQVDVASARQILQMTGVDDVTIPDALGSQPILVNMPDVAHSSYNSNGNRISLIQGSSPQVSLPDGVDLSQLGKAALRILGMAPEQAAALSAQIDWSTTLIFPFPANVDTMRQVSINGAPGMLITETRGSGSTLYWQRGERFYVLQSDWSRGDDVIEMVQLAESVR